jgi:hypothetical protein
MANQLRCIRRDTRSVSRLRERTHERIGLSAVKPLFVVLGTFAAPMLVGYVMLITFDYWAWWD